MINRIIKPAPVLGFPLCVKSKCPRLIDCTCHGSSVFLCQLEIAICERMTRVSRALSAVLFAFPPAKGRMLDDAGKKRKKKETRPGLATQRVFCVVGTLLVSDIYLNVLPAHQLALDFKDVSGSFVQVRLQFLL